MKIFVLNRKLKENEEVTLLTDSTPDNWRGENGEKLEGEWKNISKLSTKKKLLYN